MYHLIVILADPSRFLYLLLAVILGVLWYRWREHRRQLLWVIIPFLLLTILSLPVTGYLAMGSLEWSYPALEEVPADTQVIVVLSGGLKKAPGSTTRYELSSDTLGRCLCAVGLYQKQRTPILVSGGKVNPSSEGPTHAKVMRDFLIQQGVADDDVILEDRSRTTYENAVESCRILKEKDLSEVVLVTDATHLYRALGCFRKQGVDPVPAGCRYRAVDLKWSSFVPDPAAASGWQAAWHEWLGLLWYRINGRL